NLSENNISEISTYSVSLPEINENKLSNPLVIQNTVFGEILFKSSKDNSMIIIAKINSKLTLNIFFIFIFENSTGIENNTPTKAISSPVLEFSIGAIINIGRNHKYFVLYLKPKKAPNAKIIPVP